jgi:hypothetical protein
MRKLVTVLCLFISIYAVAGKSRKDIPTAPLPSVVVNAKKVFLPNGGGSDLAYDAFYSGMKKWGKYEIVGSPDEADLIVEISYHVENNGTRVWSTSNTYNGTTQVHSTQVIDPQLVLRTPFGKQLTTADWLAAKRTGKKKPSTRPRGWSMN